MSNIKNAFKNGKAFIPFITCGDPNLETSEKIICAMAKAGADLIELGIPFSDPTAEGVVIQNASERALKNKATTDKIFEMVGSVRKKVSVPMVFMTYANVVFSYGNDRFLKKSNELGIDGLILPDVPFEEKEEFETVCEKYGLDLISFIAPTSKDRILTIAEKAKGFIYCVSSLGVTGTRENIRTDIKEMIKSVREKSEVPVAVGFGISTTEQAKQIAKYADGIIVGSAIVKLCEKYGTECVEPVENYVSEMKKAITLNA